ncbi:MAG: fenitrothion hydrolase [Solirubrobacteraceae bacterium]
MHFPIRPLAAAGAGALLLAAAATWPAGALAHGLVGRAYLPVPAWLFAWAAGAVLIVSFLALPALWSVPRLEHARRTRIASLPRVLEPICGALGVAAFGFVVLSGVAGSQIPGANLAPTAVFVLFWVGIPVLSALFGDVFRAFNPWRAIARAASFAWRAAGRRVPAPLPYPDRLGYWPAAAGILAFGWLELVFVGRQHPATLAVLAVAYALVALCGMAAFGIEAWTERGDAFAVAFNLFARLSPLEYRAGAVWRRPPLAGLTDVRSLPGTTALLCTMIGTTTFDGFINGPVWRSVSPSLQRALRDLGLGGTAALELALTVGLLAAVALCVGLYRVGIAGMSLVSPNHPARRLAGTFAHSLAPIAFGYLLAHYFSLLVTQGQATAYLISDPLGTGANLFGTAGVRIDYGLLSAALIWYVQVGALVTGHVSGLALAHDRALVVYGEPRAAAESQRWMLVVMVSFTCLGLWLLSAVNT